MWLLTPAIAMAHTSFIGTMLAQMKPPTVRLLLRMSIFILPLASLGGCGLGESATPLPPTPSCAGAEASAPTIIVTPTVAPPPVGAAQQTPSRTEGELRVLAVDFVAPLFGDEARARQFMTPEYPETIADVRQRLGLDCPPDSFTVATSALAGDSGVVTLALRYPSETFPLAIHFERRTERWLVTSLQRGE